jgi:hypothetical protein
MRIVLDLLGSKAEDADSVGPQLARVAAKHAFR